MIKVIINIGYYENTTKKANRIKDHPIKIKAIDRNLCR